MQHAKHDTGLFTVCDLVDVKNTSPAVELGSNYTLTGDVTGGGANVTFVWKDAEGRDIGTEAEHSLINVTLADAGLYM